MRTFSKTLNMLFMMFVPRTDSRHCLAIHNGFIVDSMTKSSSHICAVDDFNFALLDCTQVYFIPSEHVSKVFCLM